MFPLTAPGSVGALLDERWPFLPKQQRAAGWRDVCAGVHALNWMHGTAYRRAGEPKEAAGALKLARLRMEVQQKIERSVLRWGVPPGGLNAREAMQKLQRGRGSYHAEPVAHTGPSPYSNDRLALPPDTRDCPLLRDIASDASLMMLADWKTRMLRPPEEVAELNASLGILPIYIDPVLRRQRRAYVRLVKRLLKLHMVRLSKSCKSQVGVFTVGKKDHSLRLILDCRRSNRCFLPPPGVELLTADGVEQSGS